MSLLHSPFHIYKITDNNLLLKLPTFYIKLVISYVTGKTIYPEVDNLHGKFQWFKFNKDSTEE